MVLKVGGRCVDGHSALDCNRSSPEQCLSRNHDVGGVTHPHRDVSPDSGNQIPMALVRTFLALAPRRSVAETRAR